MRKIFLCIWYNKPIAHYSNPLFVLIFWKMITRFHHIPVKNPPTGPVT